MVGRGQRGRGRRGGRVGRCIGRTSSSTTSHSDSPLVEESRADSPLVVELRTDSSPVIEPRAVSPPLVPLRDDSPPVIEPRAVSPPLVPLRDDSHPVVEPRTDSPPVVEPRDDSPPVVEPQVDNANPTKNSNIRGVTCGHGARKAMRNAKGRLTVEFDFSLMQAICNNAEFFNNEIGYIVRKHCSLRYKEWRLVPSEVREPLRNKLEILFDVDIGDENVRKVIDRQMQRAWRGHRYKLHSYFKEIGGEEDPIQAKNKCREEVSQEDWIYLCDFWSNSTYKERSKKNSEARGKRKWECRNGSKSTARHHVARGVELNASTGQIETWRIRHWHSERGWTSPQLEAKYEEMMQLRRDNPPEQMTDKEILERVIGRQSVRLFGWGRSPSTSTTTASNGDLTCPTYTQLLNTLNQYESRVVELEGTVQKMHHILIEKNIIPHSPVPHVPSDHGSDPSRPGTREFAPASRHPNCAQSGTSSDEFADAISGHDDIS